MITKLHFSVKIVILYGSCLSKNILVDLSSREANDFSKNQLGDEKMENNRDYLKRINWNKMKRFNNEIILFDVTDEFNRLEEISDSYSYNELLTANSFIKNTSHDATTYCNFYHYEILEKLPDNQKNLLIIVKSTYYNFQREINNGRNEE